MGEVHKSQEQNRTLTRNFSIIVKKDRWAEVQQYIKYYDSLGWAFYYVSQRPGTITVFFRRLDDE